MRRTRLCRYVRLGIGSGKSLSMYGPLTFILLWDGTRVRSALFGMGWNSRPKYVYSIPSTSAALHRCAPPLHSERNRV
eukprot:171880-Pyramimonas_sp.AAC.1